MLLDGAWGGGPEIAAIANALGRRVDVYELASALKKTKSESKYGEDDDNNNNDDDDEKANTISESAAYNFSSDAAVEKSPNAKVPKATFVLKKMTAFGRDSWEKGGPISILSADGRFPDLEAGEEKEKGNHFMAVFPIDADKKL